MSASAEQQLRNRIEELEAQLGYERELRNEGIAVLNYARLHHQFGLTRGECEMMRLLFEAYPRPLTVGFINDNLPNRNSSAYNRNDKIVDVYLHRIRKNLRTHTNQVIIGTVWGGWRVLTKHGFNFLLSLGFSRSNPQKGITHQLQHSIREHAS